MTTDQRKAEHTSDRNPARENSHRRHQSRRRDRPREARVGLRSRDLHQGSELAAKPVTRQGAQLEATAVLTYPPGLFHGLLLARQTQAFKAALDCAKAKDARVDIEVRSDTEAGFIARWRV